MFTGINHFCVVTSNLDRAVGIWSDRYGVGPWQVWTKDTGNMRATLHGQPAVFSFRVALAPIGDSRIEIIEPLQGDSPYSRSLTQHAGTDHIHHVRLDTDADYPTTRNHLRSPLGLVESMAAEFDGAPGSPTPFTCSYLNTEKELGFLLEVGEAPIGFTMPDAERVHLVPHGARW